MANESIVTYKDTKPEETYDQWFRRQVEEVIEAAKKPDAIWHNHEDVMADVEARRLELMSKLKKNA